MVESFLKYLQYEKRVSVHTCTAYSTDLRQFEKYISDTFPDYTIEKADYGLIRSWILSLSDSKITAPSVNRKIASLKSFYKFLMRQEVITKNPMQKIRVLKTHKRLPSFVNEGDMNKLLDTFEFKDTFEDWRDKLILELFYATGIRISELLTLKQNNVNLHTHTIKVLGKRNKERVIPFPQSLVPVIEGYIQIRNRDIESNSQGYLFVTAKGDQCYPMMVYRRIKEYLRLYTSAERTSPHVLRHTYATHLLNKGAEINAVKDLLGHSSLAATQVYTHNSIEKIKKAFDQAHPKA